PEITQVQDQTGLLAMEEGTPRVVTFDVSDVDLNPGPDTLTVSATSGNQTSIANTGLTFDAASGGGRTVTMTLAPEPDANGGPFDITVSVSDGTTSTTMIFAVYVTPVNDAPIAVDDTF